MKGWTKSLYTARMAQDGAWTRRADNNLQYQKDNNQQLKVTAGLQVRGVGCRNCWCPLGAGCPGALEPGWTGLETRVVWDVTMEEVSWLQGMAKENEVICAHNVTVAEGLIVWLHRRKVIKQFSCFFWGIFETQKFNNKNYVLAWIVWGLQCFM